MRWPDQGIHNRAKLGTFQDVMIPHAGRKFIFTRIPGGSYASVGEVYVCSGYPNNNDPWSSKDISLTSVERGCGTFDRLTAWEHAEWHYVED